MGSPCKRRPRRGPELLLTSLVHPPSLSGTATLGSALEQVIGADIGGHYWCATVVLSALQTSPVILRASPQVRNSDPHLMANGCKALRSVLTWTWHFCGLIPSLAAFLKVVISLTRLRALKKDLLSFCPGEVLC